MLKYIIASFYGFVASAALIATFAEGSRNGGRWDAMRIAGLALCVFWPVAVMCLLALACSGERGRRLMKRMFEAPVPGSVTARD